MTEKKVEETKDFEMEEKIEIYLSTKCVLEAFNKDIDFSTFLEEYWKGLYVKDNFKK